MLKVPDSSLLKILPHDLCPEIANWNRYAELLDLRVAIVGFGKMGLLHSSILNLLVPRAVKAIVDKSLLLIFGASRIIKTTKFYRDIDKMLRETEPDAAYVTTPTSSHYFIVKNLLNNDVRYVFVEKPPTLNYEQVHHLSIKKDQRIMVGFQKRYALTFRHAKLLIDDGVIGEVRHVNSYIRSGDILEPTNRFDALGRGVLLDLGVHLIDLLTWFFKVKRIIKAESKNVYTRVDDVFRAELEAEENVKISLEASWSSPEYRTPETYIEVQGTLGTMKVTEDYLKVNTKVKHPLLSNKEEIVLYKPHYYQGILPVNLADPEYTIENMHFLKCIHGNEEPLTSIENSLDTMKLIDTLYEKAESYKWLEK
jgi:predicted dehydrogenase